MLLPALLAGSVSPAPAIVGASREASRYADRLVMVLNRGPEGSGFCTGVVLSSNIVLTAAHCLRPTRDMLVLYRDAAGQPVTLEVAAATTHPDFRADAIQRRVVSVDAALLETATPLPSAFRPAALAREASARIGQSVIAVGFGTAREGVAKTGGTLRAADLAVRAPASQVLLWADDPDQAGLGACSGDSGAPIFDEDGETVLAIVAWTAGAQGRKCGHLTQGPLVAPLQGWIAAVEEHWRR